jgi:hypothetical protein
MRSYAITLASVLLAGGCNLYWGGHTSGDDTCVEPAGGGLGPSDPAQPVQRDPNTGACVPVQNEGCPCGEECSPPAEIVTGSCSGPCEDLDETSCLATAGCHAAYTEDTDPTPLGGSAGESFLACWDIEPLTPLEGGDCTQNDAYSCAQHDDCVSVLANGEFAVCDPEGSGVDPCNGLSCGSGYECGVSCDGQGDCAPACVATGQVGTCEGSGGVDCNIAGPSCPAGTTPGVIDECWSGYCIPDDECNDSCMSYTDANDCVDNNCTAVYVGSDCTCYSSGTCSCATETFESCE